MDTATVEKELVVLEEGYWTALKERNAEAAARLTDFPCLITGPQGVGRIGREAFTAMMNDPRYTLERFELRAVEVRLLREDVAVVAYKVHEDLTVDGEPVSLEAADASTWIRRDGRWGCAMHSEALAGDPFGRDRLAAP
jgi:uncharacterized protein (TIGR02246 family)